METFGKATLERCGASATVTRVRRAALPLSVISLLILGGFSASLLAGTGGGPASTTAATAAVTTSPASSVVVVSGRGWGHGLGLSQWGAYGYARHGWTYDRILAHYYTGTTLGPAKVSTVRVLLAQA